MSKKLSSEEIQKIENDYSCRVIAVSKTRDENTILDVYKNGIKDFGENKVQELEPKYESLPKDIKWHFIGHLQRNKVKYIAPFVYLIHSVDSARLLREINKQALKNDRIIDCLLQIHIAREETKFGLDENELFAILNEDLKVLNGVRIKGLMGMATNTEDHNKVRTEFRALKNLFDKCKDLENEKVEMEVLSMGMSQDYNLALEEGSNMIRIGTAIFGPRNDGNE